MGIRLDMEKNYNKLDRMFIKKCFLNKGFTDKLANELWNV